MWVKQQARPGVTPGVLKTQTYECIALRSPTRGHTRLDMGVQDQRLVNADLCIPRCMIVARLPFHSDSSPSCCTTCRIALNRLGVCRDPGLVGDKALTCTIDDVDHVHAIVTDAQTSKSRHAPGTRW
jgi:hypothetical protein